MAGRDYVSAQKAFLEENGCDAGRCSACDVTILKETNQPVVVVAEDIAISAPVVEGFRFDFWAGTGR